MQTRSTARNRYDLDQARRDAELAEYDLEAEREQLALELELDDRQTNAGRPSSLPSVCAAVDGRSENALTDRPAAAGQPTTPRGCQSSMGPPTALPSRPDASTAPDGTPRPSVPRTT